MDLRQIVFSGFRRKHLFIITGFEKQCTRPLKKRKIPLKTGCMAEYCHWSTFVFPYKGGTFKTYFYLFLYSNNKHVGFHQQNTLA